MLLGVHTYSRPHTQVEVMPHQHIFLHLSLSQVWSNSHGGGTLSPPVFSSLYSTNFCYKRNRNQNLSAKHFQGFNISL